MANAVKHLKSLIESNERLRDKLEAQYNETKEAHLIGHINQLNTQVQNACSTLVLRAEDKRSIKELLDAEEEVKRTTKELAESLDVRDRLSAKLLAVTEERNALKAEAEKAAKREEVLKEKNAKLTEDYETLRQTDTSSPQS